MKLVFRGKVPFVINTRCLESSYVEIHNDRICYDAKIDISNVAWTEAENIKKVNGLLHSKNTFLETFEEISPNEGYRIKITYRIEDIIGEFYCTSIEIIQPYNQGFSLIAKNCVYKNPILEIEAVIANIFSSDKAAKQKNIDLNNIPNIHISEVPSHEQIPLSFETIITDTEIADKDFDITINYIEYSVTYSGFMKNTREKYDKEGFRIEYGRIYYYHAFKKFKTLEELEEYLGHIGNIFTFILDFRTKNILQKCNFISSSQLIGTKGNKVKELNSILGVEFIKEIDDYECLI